jgi:hypothetical protein
MDSDILDPNTCDGYEPNIECNCNDCVLTFFGMDMNHQYYDFGNSSRYITQDEIKMIMEEGYIIGFGGKIGVICNYCCDIKGYTRYWIEAHTEECPEFRQEWELIKMKKIGKYLELQKKALDKQFINIMRNNKKVCNLKK